MPQTVRDALLAALVTFVLAVPLVGFQAVDTGGPLGLEQRWDWVAGGVIVVFLGRLALTLLRHRRAPASEREAWWTTLHRRIPALAPLLL